MRDILLHSLVISGYAALAFTIWRALHREIDAAPPAGRWTHAVLAVLLLLHGFLKDG